jgi:hypothetical protein
MGEPATHLPAQSSADTSADDLAAQIEALLGGGELEAALAPKQPPKAKAVEKPAEPTPAVTEAGAKEPAAKAADGEESLTQDELGSAIEQMLQSAVAKVDQIQAQTDAMVEVAAAEALAAAKAGSEAKAVDPADAKKQVESTNTDSTAAAVPDAAVSASFEDELTALAEQLTAEFKNQSETLNAKADVAEKAPAPEAVKPGVVQEQVVEATKVEASSSAAMSAERVQTAAKVAETAAASVPAAVAAAVPAVPHAVQPLVHTDEHAAVVIEAPPAPKKPRKPIGPIIRGMVGKALSPIGAASGATGRALGKPLSMQKPMIRDSAGWIAVVTIFMAGCMWAAVLLRDPKPYVPAIAPMTLVEEGGGGHGGGGGGHGDKKAAGGHGEKKPAAGGGHGEAKKADGGHGPAASPIVKREPLIQRGPPGAKKPAPKPASGGGGH